MLAEARLLSPKQTSVIREDLNVLFQTEEDGQPPEGVMQGAWRVDLENTGLNERCQTRKACVVQPCAREMSGQASPRTEGRPRLFRAGGRDGQGLLGGMQVPFGVSSLRTGWRRWLQDPINTLDDVECYIEKWLI